MRAIQLAVACVALLAATAGQVQAGIITNNVGISSPGQVITFDEFTFATGTPITNQFSSLGASFSPNMYYNVQPVFFPTASLASFSPATNVSVFFNQNVTAAAVALQSNTEATTFTAKLNGSVVESFTTTTTLSVLPSLTHASDFYGFEGIVFDELRIENASQLFQIDNLQFANSAAVPEPSSLAMFGIGACVAGVGDARRRRREKQQEATA